MKNNTSEDNEKESMSLRDQYAFELLKVFLNNQGQVNRSVFNKIKCFLGIGSRKMIYEYNYNSCVKSSYEVADMMLEAGEKINESKPITLLNKRTYPSDIFKRAFLKEKGDINTVECEVAQHSTFRHIGGNKFEVTTERVIPSVPKEDRTQLNEGVRSKDDQPQPLKATDNNLLPYQFLDNKKAFMMVMKAIKAGNLSEVKSIFENNNIDINRTYKRGSTLLSSAVNIGHIGIVKFLLSKEPDMYINRRSLARACVSGSLEMIKLLLDAGIDPNAQGITGRTPLMVASDRNRLEIIQFLLNKGADINMRSFKDKTVLMHANVKDAGVVFRLLVERAIHLIDEQDNEGWTVLMTAAYNDNFNTVRFLLDKGANTNIKNNDGLDVLAIAKNKRHERIVKLLESRTRALAAISELANRQVKAKVDPSKKITCKLELQPIPFQETTEKKQDSNMVVTARPFFSHSEERLKKFFKVIKEGTLLEIESTLDNNEMYLNEKDANGSTALCLAVSREDIDIVKLVLSKKPDVDKNNHALHRACRLNGIEIVELLLDYGLDINSRNENNKTPLMIAVYRNSTELSKILLDRGADINARSNNEKTVLMHTTYNSSIILSLLIEKGKQHIDAQDNKGNTMLMKAVHRNNIAIVKLLLEKNANINIKDKEGWTALMIAESTRNKRIIQLLQDMKTNRTPMRDWLFAEDQMGMSGRLRYSLLEKNKKGKLPFEYLEQVDKESFLQIKGLGEVSWKEFVKLRGY